MADNAALVPELPVAVSNKAGQVYGRLKALIMLQKMPPNTRLEMKTIADDLGVSITPVREALLLLAHEGVIGKDSSRSYVTLPLRLGDVKASYEVAFMIARFAIEKNIGAFSTQGLHLADITNTSDQEPAVFARTVADAIESLFERIAGLTDNPHLVRYMQDFLDRTGFLRELELHDQDRCQAVTQSITAFVDILESGNAAASAESLQSYMVQTVERLPGLIRTANAQAFDEGHFLDEGGGL